MGSAFEHGVVVGGLAAAIAVGVALCMFGPPYSALIAAALEGAGFVWVAFGTASYARGLALVPMRPQRNLLSTNQHEQGAL